MKCAWKELLSILPPSMRQNVDALAASGLQELRLRLQNPPELVLDKRRLWLERTVTAEDLSFVVNTASRYSPWIGATSALGYITAPGGHRIGICGDAVIRDEKMGGFRTIRSLNIRVARDYPGISGELSRQSGSVLIVGKPGCGKTTLLRDLIRQRSKTENIAVVDERGELFPERAGFDTGFRTDILTGCGKAQGLERMLRTMTPDTIAVDEVTAEDDCKALLQAAWCGVHLLATAHASGKQDLLARPIYAPLIQSGVFEQLVIMRADKSWHWERMDL